MSIIGLIKARIDELEDLFNEKKMDDRYFLRRTLILNIIILAQIDQENSEIYLLRVRELGYRGSVWN